MSSQGSGAGPPPRGDWSSPPPTRAEWSSPGPTRSEWSAPPTPRGLRADWNNAAERIPLPRPESLPSPVDRDKSTLKVHLPNGGFNVVKFGDATDIKVWLMGIIKSEGVWTLIPAKIHWKGSYSILSRLANYIYPRFLHTSGAQSSKKGGGCFFSAHLISRLRRTGQL